MHVAWQPEDVLHLPATNWQIDMRDLVNLF